MPIRFRCAYCNQLMGIARRKAGTVVRCPRCAGEVIVPAEPQPQAANGAGRLNQLFEEEDFAHELADVEPVVPQPLPAAPMLPPYGHASLPANEPLAPVALDVPPMYNVQRTGVFLTPLLLLVVGVLTLGLLAVVFLLGFFLGRASV